MSEEKDIKEPKGPKDWNGKLIEVGDTVYFNMLDEGKVLGEDKDGRIRVESWQESLPEGRPWKIVWQIPPGLLRKKKPGDDIEAKKTVGPTSRGHCNR